MKDDNLVKSGGDILIADDSPDNLQILSKILKEHGHKVRPVMNGMNALKAATVQPPDLILLDITMPEMNGFEVCKRLKADPALKDIPIIFISGLAEIDDKLHAFEIGGVDYITKPFMVKEVMARVSTHLKLRSLQKELEHHNNNLQDIIQMKVRDITELQMATIFAIVKLAECRDFSVKGHLERTSEYCRFLSTMLERESEYEDQINGSFIKNIAEASPLHDIGKVGIPDEILLKPGKLTSDEFEIMKRHTVIGADALEDVKNRYPRHDFIETGMLIARYHHERWDGKGYPNGLSGTDIPLCARIMAIADVYDALTSKRVYKDSMSHEDSCDIIRNESGRQFDPVVVEVFLNNHLTFVEIRKRFAEMFGGY